MSVSRYHEFTCDFCQTKARLERYGLPDGFIYITASMPRNLPSKHACPKCQKGLSIAPTERADEWVWEDAPKP
jgi:hypothetical protein